MPHTCSRTFHVHCQQDEIKNPKFRTLKHSANSSYCGDKPPLQLHISLFSSSASLEEIQNLCFSQLPLFAIPRKHRGIFFSALLAEIPFLFPFTYEVPVHPSRPT